MARTLLGRGLPILVGESQVGAAERDDRRVGLGAGAAPPGDSASARGDEPGSERPATQVLLVGRDGIDGEVLELGRVAL